MSELEYFYREGEASCSKHRPLKVRLDGRIVGSICKVDGGYQYFPKGKKFGGDVFASVTEVQQSLQDDLSHRDYLDSCIGKIDGSQG